MTEGDFHEVVVLHQRVRICLLESDLRQAAEALHRAEGVIRTVLNGSGASLLDKLTAGAALAEAQGIVMRALIPPLTKGDAPQAPLKSPSEVQSAYVERQPLHVCKVLPLKAASAAFPETPQEKP